MRRLPLCAPRDSTSRTHADSACGLNPCRHPQPALPAGSPASVVRLGITWNAHSARSCPAAKMISPFASDWTLLSPAFGAFLHGWTTTKSGTLAAGLENMRRGVAMLREQNILLFDGLLKIALAEAEAAAGDHDRALAVLDEGLSTADRLGHRTFEAELHRARGDILLQREPASP